MQVSKKMSTRYIAVCAMFIALSYVAVLISKVIPNVAGFLSYEPKDAVIVIAGFIYGPMTSFLISVIVSFGTRAPLLNHSKSRFRTPALCR